MLFFPKIGLKHTQSVAHHPIFLTCLALVYSAKTRRQWLSEFLNGAFGHSGMRVALMAQNTVPPRQSWKETLKITGCLLVDVEFLCNTVPSKAVQLCHFNGM